MSVFYYKAADRQGKIRKGIISADDRKKANIFLSTQGLIPIEISASRSKKTEADLKGEDLLTFTQLLSQLINARIPLYDALVAIQEQYVGERFHPLLFEICEQVKAGSSLSQAMANYPNSFDSLYCAMVMAGELSGNLPFVLENLGELLKKKEKVKKDILSALLYPAIIGVVCFVVIIIMLTFVVPVIENLLEDRPVNPFTRTVLTISHILKFYWFIYLPILIGLGALLRWQWTKPRTQLWLDKTYLDLPLIRSFTIISNMGRFCRTLATLIVGGVPLVEALRIAQGVVTNSVLQKLIVDAEAEILAGSSLSLELSKSPLIPNLMTRMLNIGENSGKMGKMLTNIAEIYEGQTEKTLSYFSTLTYPVILIIMGVIIGVIMLAVLLPLTDVSSLMS